MSNPTRRWALGMLLPALALSLSVLTGAAGAQEVPEVPEAPEFPVPDPQIPAPPPGGDVPDLPESPEPPDAPEPPEVPDPDLPEPEAPEPPGGDVPDVPEDPDLPGDVETPGIGVLTIPPDVPEEACDPVDLPSELCAIAPSGSTDDTTAGTIPGSDATTQVLGAGVAAAGGPMLPRTGPPLPLGIAGALLLAAGAALVRRSLITP